MTRTVDPAAAPVRLLPLAAVGAIALGVAAVVVLILQRRHVAAAAVSVCVFGAAGLAVLTWGVAAHRLLDYCASRQDAGWDVRISRSYDLVHDTLTCTVTAYDTGRTVRLHQRPWDLLHR